MANTYKNIVITPNINTDPNTVPVIRFSGGDATSNTDINVRVYTAQNGTLSFEGSAGQLFSITNDLTNVIFSVNDVSGIPSLEIDANGKITLAQYGGNVGIRTGNPVAPLQVNGHILITQNNTSALDTIGEIAEFTHNANSYVQIHVRNANTGLFAAADVVATADIGTDTTEFIDLGINNSNYNDPTFTIAGAKDGYLYTSNGNLAIGTANAGKALVFFTGGTLAASERARIEPSGNFRVNGNTLVVDAPNGEVGIGTTLPIANLQVIGSNIANTVNIVGNTVVTGVVYANSFVGFGQGFANMNVISTVGYQVWNVPRGVRRWKVTAVGGGGAGGGSFTAVSHHGNGGGSGGVTIGFYNYVPGVDTMAMNVGIGGLQYGPLNANGFSGNSTNVNYNSVWLFANAGTGGANSWFGGNVNAIGIGGAAVGGSINLVGDDGGFGGIATGNTPFICEGGHTPLGWGQGGVIGVGTLTTGSNGTNASGFGAGGGAGRTGTAGTAKTGGIGANGVIIIEW